MEQFVNDGKVDNVDGGLSGCVLSNKGCYR